MTKTFLFKLLIYNKPWWFLLSFVRFYVLYVMIWNRYAFFRGEWQRIGCSDQRLPSGGTIDYFMHLKSLFVWHFFCPTPLEYSRIHITVCASVHLFTFFCKVWSVLSWIVFKTFFLMYSCLACGYIKEASHFEILCERLCKHVNRQCM